MSSEMDIPEFASLASNLLIRFCIPSMFKL
jgi:hypothetical protein